MTNQQAITLAIAALERQIRALVFDANLHDVMGADYPYAIKASARRKELREAIAQLRQPQQIRMRI